MTSEEHHRTTMQCDGDLQRWDERGDQSWERFYGSSLLWVNVECKRCGYRESEIPTDR